MITRCPKNKHLIPIQCGRLLYLSFSGKVSPLAFTFYDGLVAIQNIIINGNLPPSRVAALGSRAWGCDRPCQGEDLHMCRSQACLSLEPLSLVCVLEHKAAEAQTWEAQSHPVLKCLS
jgi:hypothetical protein